MSNRNPDPNTPRQDVGDEDAQAGVVDQSADQYRLTRGELSRVSDDGTMETITQGDVFEATDDEIRSFGDLLEPADEGGVGQPVAEQPIPENAGADYVSRGERGEREPNPGADASDFEDANVTPDAVDDQDPDDLGEVDQPVPNQTNADYESRAEQGERDGTEVPDADDFAEAEADVDQEALGGPAETQPEDRAEVEQPTPSEDAATETVEEQTEDVPDSDADAEADADADADGESGNADAPDDADGEAEAAIDAIPSDYDSMNVGDVREFVRSEDPNAERLQALLQYEEEHKNRTTVTDDLEERIADATTSDGGV